MVLSLGDLPCLVKVKDMDKKTRVLHKIASLGTQVYGWVDQVCFEA